MWLGLGLSQQTDDVRVPPGDLSRGREVSESTVSETNVPRTAAPSDRRKGVGVTGTGGH